MSDIGHTESESEELKQENVNAPQATAITPEGTATIQGVIPPAETTDRHEGTPQISITSTAAEEVLKAERPSEYLPQSTQSAIKGEE